jgi:acyl-CoA thioesterase FadM
MARVQITLPARFDFSTELDVRITDINYGNHLANDAVLSLLHEARVRWLRRNNLGEANVDGLLLIMSDAAVVYKAEGFAGDRLRIEVAAAEPSRVGCDIVYRVTRISDNKVIVEAKTGVVFLDPGSRKVVRLPPTMLALASRSADAE